MSVYGTPKDSPGDKEDVVSFSPKLDIYNEPDLPVQRTLHPRRMVDLLDTSDVKFQVPTKKVPIKGKRDAKRDYLLALQKAATERKAALDEPGHIVTPHEIHYDDIVKKIVLSPKSAETVAEHPMLRDEEKFASSRRSSYTTMSHESEVSSLKVTVQESSRPPAEVLRYDMFSPEPVKRIDSSFAINPPLPIKIAVVPEPIASKSVGLVPYDPERRRRRPSQTTVPSLSRRSSVDSGCSSKLRGEINRVPPIFDIQKSMLYTPSVPVQVFPPKFVHPPGLRIFVYENKTTLVLTLFNVIACIAVELLIETVLADSAGNVDGNFFSILRVFIYFPLALCTLVLIYRLAVGKPPLPSLKQYQMDIVYPPPSLVKPVSLV